MLSNIDLLNALYSGTSSPIPITVDGIATTSETFTSWAAPDGQVEVSANMSEGVAYLIGKMDSVGRDAVNECRLLPTAAIFNGDTMYVMWAFDVSVSCEDAGSVAAEAGMLHPEAYIPLPPAGGFEIVCADMGRVYSLTQIREAYVPVTYANATVVAPYAEADYASDTVITFGSKRDSKHWKPLTMPAGAFIALLCRHKEGAKDGQAFVLGDLVPGQRLKTSVKALYGVGLDIDTGTPTETIDAALKKLGCLAVRYSTHSSGKTKTEIKKDNVVKFAGDREIDDALMHEFLIAVEQWDRTIIDTVAYHGVEHTEKGLVCQITHAPMPRHRIVLLFKKPFDMNKEAPTQAEAMKKWAKVPEALANLLGVPFDTSCTDPSRLFYLPRHAKGEPFSISLFGGPYFDWRTLELENTIDKLASATSQGKSKSVTEKGRELGRWHVKRGHGFQIADVLDAHAPDRIRHNTGHGYEIECPFDENHHNPGDQEDRACIVVNAGEGPSEFFTISCRHEGCRDKTMLDMLGKMLTDGWFAESVLEDEQFNAIVEDVLKPSGGGRKSNQSSLIDRIAREYPIPHMKGKFLYVIR